MTYLKAELGDYLEYDGKLMKVIAIAEGKTIIMEPVGHDNAKCPECGYSYKKQIDSLESCPNFQNGANPIKTIK